MKSRKWLYNFVCCVCSWAENHTLDICPLCSSAGSIRNLGTDIRVAMQHVGGYAWSLITAHSWPCRHGLAPLDPFVHLHCPPWALGLGRIIISSNSVSKTKKMVKELDHRSCSDDSTASKMVLFYIWRCNKPQHLSGRGPCRSVGLRKNSVSSWLHCWR